MIQKLQQQIGELQSQIAEKKKQIAAIQSKEIQQVKNDIVRKYLKILEKTELYKIDDEALQAVFTLANIQNGNRPQIEIRYLLDGRIDIRYFNVREDAWHIL